jgi:hypothetical protein
VVPRQFNHQLIIKTGYIHQIVNLLLLSLKDVGHNHVQSFGNFLLQQILHTSVVLTNSKRGKNHSYQILHT